MYYVDMSDIIYSIIEEYVKDIHPGWYRYSSQIRRSMNFGIVIFIEARDHELHVVREYGHQFLCSMKYDIHCVLDIVSFLINTIEEMKRDSLALDRGLLLEAISEYEPKRC